MKSALVLAAAAGAVAQNFAGIPPCALPCITSAITAVGCQATDVACQCGPSQQAIVNTAGACVLSGCAATPSAIQEAITAGSSLCRAYSATAGSGSTATTATGTVPTGTVTSITGTITTGSITTGSATTRANNTVTTSGGNNSATNKPTGPSTSGTAGAGGTSISTSTPGGAAATVGAGALIGLLGLVAAL